MKVAIRGMGRMGREVAELARESSEIEFLVGIDPRGGGDLPCVAKLAELAEIKEKPDCILDLSLHSAIGEVLNYAKQEEIPLVIGTTGFTEGEKEAISLASREIPIFLSGNFSLGLSLLTAFAVKVAEMLPEGDIEIVESHHREKRDAPSGTALMLLDAIQKVRPHSRGQYGRQGDRGRQEGEIGIHSLRMGDTVGEHTLYITTPTQQLILRHTATNRALFAEGAIRAVRFLYGKPQGLYGMTDLTGGNI